MIRLVNVLKQGLLTILLSIVLMSVQALRVQAAVPFTDVVFSTTTPYWNGSMDDNTDSFGITNIPDITIFFEPGFGNIQVDSQVFQVPNSSGLGISSRNKSINWFHLSSFDNAIDFDINSFQIYSAASSSVDLKIYGFMDAFDAYELAESGDTSPTMTVSMAKISTTVTVSSGWNTISLTGFTGISSLFMDTPENSEMYFNHFSIRKSPIYIITKNPSDSTKFDVTNGTGSAILNGTSKSWVEAMSSIDYDNGDSTTSLIQLGVTGTPLSMSSAQIEGNKLISGIYSGSVVFTVVNNNPIGFTIKDSVVSFDGLSIDNVNVYGTYIPVDIRTASSTLNFKSRSLISSKYTDTYPQSGSYLIRNSGTLNIEGGTLKGDPENRFAIGNQVTGILNVSGGLVESQYNDLNEFGAAISNSGTLNVSGSASIVSTGYGVDDNDGTISISGGEIKATGLGTSIYLQNTGSDSTKTSLNIAGGLITSENNTLYVSGGSGKVLISGGTIKSTDTTSAGSGVRVGYGYTGNFIWSGGTIQSVNENTLYVDKVGTSTDLAKITIGSNNFYSHSDAELRIRAPYVSNIYEASPSSMISNGEITVMNISTGYGFAGWFSEQSRTNAVVSTQNTSSGVSINTISSASNLYVKLLSSNATITSVSSHYTVNPSTNTIVKNQTVIDDTVTVTDFISKLSKDASASWKVISSSETAIFDSANAKSNTDNLSVGDKLMVKAADGTVKTYAITVEVSNVVIPSLTSSSYDVNTGILSVTGENFLALSGSSNDILANKFTLRGEGGSTYTLTDTSNVEISSATQFSLSLSSTDKAAVNLLLNKNGLSSTSGTSYNLSALEDWNGGASSSLLIADLSNNSITVTGIISVSSPVTNAVIAIPSTHTTLETLPNTGNGDSSTYILRNLLTVGSILALILSAMKKQK